MPKHDIWLTLVKLNGDIVRSRVCESRFVHLRSDTFFFSNCGEVDRENESDTRAQQQLVEGFFFPSFPPENLSRPRSPAPRES